MKIFRSKKGFWFLAFLFIIVTIAMFYAYSEIILKTTAPSYTLGDEAVLLIDQLQKSEKIMLYQEKAAKDSAAKAIREYSSTGGGLSDCGEYNGVPLWNSNYATCYPVKDSFFDEKFEEIFMNYFKDSLKAYSPAKISDPHIAVYEEDGKLHLTGIEDETKRLTITDNSKKTIGSSATPNDMVPSNLGDFNIGQTIEIKNSQGDEESWIKIGKIQSDDYWMKDEALTILESYYINPHNPDVLDKDEILQRTDEATYIYLKGQNPEYFKTEKEMMEFTGLPMDVTNLPFEFQTIPKPVGEKQGIVDFGDVWEAASASKVNYYIVLSVCAAESDFKHTENPAGAHGVMQMYKPAISETIKLYGPDLIKNFPKELNGLQNNDDWVDKIYDDFTKQDSDNVKLQLFFGAYYLQVSKYQLEQSSKNPDITVKNIIQAYHDGAGNIAADGSLLICNPNHQYYAQCPEALNYISRVQGKYEQFATS